MTRIVIGLLAAIALLFVIVLARTEMTAAPPAQTSTSPLSFNIDPRGIAAHLAQAVRFQTVSYSAGVSEDEKIQALDAMRAWMEKTSPNFHKVAARETFDHSLLFTWKGKNPNLAPLLLQTLRHLSVSPDT